MRLQSRLSEEKKITESLNRVIAKKDEMVNDSLKNIRTSEGDAEKMRHELMTYRVTCEGLKAEKEETDKRFTAYQDKIRALEKEVSEIREAKNSLDQEVNTQRFRLTSMKGKMENNIKDRDHYKTEYENVQVNVRKVRQELASMKN
ncbi:uncharacterized protein LOC116617483 [Nematostella vectensis]|uniref:uncharacterized protein LOC116617483 n=1 Tax=Nematostella vectensis TaxID=45351 RepID=UPI0020778A0C|nr:uncharacterized protein LOC116617483 [Nematostella vectensis]